MLRFPEVLIELWFKERQVIRVPSPNKLSIDVAHYEASLWITARHCNGCQGAYIACTNACHYKIAGLMLG